MVIFSDEGIMTHDVKGNLVPVESDSQSFIFNGVKVFDFKSGNLQISMYEEELDKFTTLVYGGREFEKPRLIGLPHYFGTQQVAGVKSINPLPNLTNPYYQFHVETNSLSMGMSNEEESSIDQTVKRLNDENSKPSKSDSFSISDVFRKIKNYF